ncbi:hypothetical protein EVAR_31757_1 [Eumeta japonica]|uniref:Uncharacterized protein n=1 Tax=Eumeta variegata TaxID=151549 RepID=A0A4C1W5P8_EUMVA|nr:hypothetical protein EVAR_31757_1 [Eumeta japonica]
MAATLRITSRQGIASMIRDRVRSRAVQVRARARADKILPLSHRIIIIYYRVEGGQFAPRRPTPPPSPPHPFGSQLLLSLYCSRDKRRNRIYCNLLPEGAFERINEVRRRHTRSKRRSKGENMNLMHPTAYIYHT